jgi:hypothetical protein
MHTSDDFPMTLEREAGMPDFVPPVAVAFGLYPVLDNAKTKDAGHEVYKDVEFVRIAIPGDRNSLFFQPADRSHQMRFPKAYDAFKRRETAPVEGMPIDQWAPISRSVALTLKAMHVHTVEALAAVHEGHIDKIGGNGRQLRAKAQAWLAEAQTGAEAIRLAAEKTALQDQLASLQAQIVALQQNASNPQAKNVPVAPIADPTDTVEQDVAAAARRPRRSAA